MKMCVMHLKSVILKSFFDDVVQNKDLSAGKLRNRSLNFRDFRFLVFIES